MVSSSFRRKGNSLVGLEPVCSLPVPQHVVQFSVHETRASLSVVISTDTQCTVTRQLSISSKTSSERHRGDHHLLQMNCLMWIQKGWVTLFARCPDVTCGSYGSWTWNRFLNPE